MDTMIIDSFKEETPLFRTIISWKKFSDLFSPRSFEKVYKYLEFSLFGDHREFFLQ